MKITQTWIFSINKSPTKPSMMMVENFEKRKRTLNFGFFSVQKLITDDKIETVDVSMTDQSATNCPDTNQ